MEIDEKALKSHSKLSLCNTRFLDFIKTNPQGLKEENFNLLELNDPLFKLQPWPTFIDGQTKREIIEANQKVLNLLRAIPQRVFGGDYEKMSQYYGISPDLAKYFLCGVTDSHLNGLLARGDFILDSSGWKCLEYNVNTNLGGMAISFWESLYLATPIISDFLRQNQINIKNKNIFEVLFEHLVKLAVEFFPTKEEVNLAIVTLRDSGGENRWMREKYFNSLYEKVLKFAKLEGNRLNGRVFFCDYSQLEVSGDRVYFGENKIHHIVEWCQGFVPNDILHVFYKKKVLIYNGAIAWLLSTKLNLALLSELKDSNFLNHEEKEIIEKYIPWTRKVKPGETTYEGERIDLLRLLHTHKDNLVLKPLVGTGGYDIYVGRYTCGEKWNRVVEQALEADNWQKLDFTSPMTEAQWKVFVQKALDVKSWVVQEYVDSPTYLYQQGAEGYGEHHAVWGFFMFGNTYAGAWARVQPLTGQTGVINCHQGAKVSVVFEVD